MRKYSLDVIFVNGNNFMELKQISKNYYWKTFRRRYNLYTIEWTFKQNDKLLLRMLFPRYEKVKGVVYQKLKTSYSSELNINLRQISRAAYGYGYGNHSHCSFRLKYKLLTFASRNF